MTEYIERKAFRKQLIDRQITTAFFNNEQRREIGCIVEMLDNAPAANVVEVVQGRWVPVEYDGYADGYPVWELWECSECREEHRGDEDTLTNYCPNCGAKMDGGEA